MYDEKTMSYNERTIKTNLRNNNVTLCCVYSFHDNSENNPFWHEGFINLYPAVYFSLGSICSSVSHKYQVVINKWNIEMKLVTYGFALRSSIVLSAPYISIIMSTSYSEQRYKSTLTIIQWHSSQINFGHSILTIESIRRLYRLVEMLVWFHSQCCYHQLKLKLLTIIFSN